MILWFDPDESYLLNGLHSGGSIPGVGNLRPAGRIRPAKDFNQAHLLAVDVCQNLNLKFKNQFIKYGLCGK
jgi:hypothetical protein